MTNVKKKSGNHERSVAKLFEDWSGYEFARTPQSGGLHWRKAHTSGDIVCIDNQHGLKFPFSIECKFYEELLLLPLIQGLIGKKSNKILEFWVQSDRDARNVNKIPLVFMRKNGMKKGLNFVMMGQDFFNKWLSLIGVWDTEYGFLGYTDSNYQLVIINSDELMKTEYQLFFKAGRKLLRNVANSSI